MNHDIKERDDDMKIIKCFAKDNKGIGVVEIILILVILIALVLLFKDRIGNITNKALNSIESDSGEIIDDEA